MEEQSLVVQDNNLELKVEGITLGTLTTNAKTILETVKVKLKGYKAENYSGDNIQAAKDDKARLNATSKKLNDERIRLEKEFMKPFDEFKGVVTETCQLIVTASSAIDSVVKTVEEQEKQEKKTLIENFFASTGCQYFTLDKIFKPQWLNKTVKLKAIEAEITQAISKTEGDLAVLDKIGEPEAKAMYLNTLDLNRAISEADRIKQNRERLAKIEQEKAQAVNHVEPAVVQNPAQAPVTTMRSVRMDTVVASKKVEVETFTFTLKITGTRESLEGLKSYMAENNLTYEKVQ